MWKIKKIDIVIFCVLIVVFLLSRLINLTSLPIFTDEAIYLRWAQIAKNDANWRFISLTDGKQPLYVWLAMIAMKMISDPLIAGRVVSVFSGLLGMLFIGLLTWEIFRNKKAAFLASILYLIYPSSLFYDRMALMDGLLAVLTIITLYLEILLVKKVRLDLALLTGMAMGATMLVKTSGFFTLYLLPLSLLLFDFSPTHSVILGSPKGDTRIKEKTDSGQARMTRKRILKWLFWASIAAVLSQIYYSVLRLSPFFHMIAEKDTTFVYPFSEWVTRPFVFFLGNLHGLTGWTILYLTWPVVLAIILALVFAIKKFTRERLFLFLWFLGPFIALALFGKVLYPRFILFMTMPLLVLAASSLLEISRVIKNLKWQIVLLGFAVIPSLVFDQKLLFDITHSSLTQIDQGQYVNDWPAGWGVKEANTYLSGEAKKGKIAIFTDGTFGLMPYAIELYLVYDKNVTIKGLWPLTEEFPSEITASAKKIPTYFIANQKKDLPSAWPLVLVGQWQKGINNEASLRLYHVVISSQTQTK